MEPLGTAFLIALTLFGLVFGSFANVLIWRIPREESIVSPGSRCPSCGTPIRWYDNVPVLSWMLLKARCRSCGEPISGRYPLVEALSGLLWLTAGLRFGMTWATAWAVALFYLLLVLSFIDLDVRRLPNVLVAILAVIGLGGVALSQSLGVGAAPLVGLASSGALSSPLLVSALGAGLGAGVSGLIAWLYRRVRGRHGLGAGDVKLLGAMGLFTGPFVMLALFVGSVLGAVSGIRAASRSGQGGRTMLPFGPFLALGCVVSVLWGPALWEAYARLIGL